MGTEACRRRAADVPRGGPSILRHAGAAVCACGRDPRDDESDAADDDGAPTNYDTTADDDEDSADDVTTPSDDDSASDDHAAPNDYAPLDHINRSSVHVGSHTSDDNSPSNNVGGTHDGPEAPANDDVDPDDDQSPTDDDEGSHDLSVAEHF